jgi:hypothetical protein
MSPSWFRDTHDGRQPPRAGFMHTRRESRYPANHVHPSGHHLSWRHCFDGLCSLGNKPHGRAGNGSRTIHLPGLGQNTWAKPDALLRCGNCYRDGEVVLMLGAPNQDAKGAVIRRQPIRQIAATAQATPQERDYSVVRGDWNRSRDRTMDHAKGD